MSPADFAHGRVDLGDLRLHYVTAGQGEPVVLLHGFPQTWFAWRRVVPALAARYTVIAPDLRGMGDSGKPQGGYDKRTAAGDIRELVRALGHERIRLVGHDVGGWVSYPYAAAHPEEVEKLVMVQALVPGYGLERNMREAWHFGFHMAPDLPEALVSGRERMYLNYYYRALPQDAKDNEELAKTKLAMPVLGLGGEFAEGEDGLRSVRHVGEDVRGGIVERAGHSIPEERPDSLGEMLLDFFDR